jgi:hypothetical protein
MPTDEQIREAGIRLDQLISATMPKMQRPVSRPAIPATITAIDSAVSEL